MNVGNRIDVHHHLVPPAFRAVTERRGITHVAGAPLPRWDVTRSLRVMDDNAIASALLSLSCPGVYFGDRAEACDLARACNEFSAELRDRHPDRFGFFAVLPMPFTSESCREAEYALDTLKADGVVLLGSTDGVFLGDPKLDELMHELDRRHAIVFEHPNMHATSEQLGLGAPGFLLEFMCDTTRAATNLIMTGTMEKYPGITWILSHAGGFLPYVAWRLSLANLMADLAPNVPQGVLTYIRRFYFDTALSPSPYSAAALNELVDPSHILFGSDFPFAPEPLTANQITMLERGDVWSVDQTRAIMRNNALALFPRFSKQDEGAPARPAHRTVGIGGRVQNALRRPVLAVAERMRNR